MAEWFKAHAWKVCVLSKVPRVRIPVSPPQSAVIRYKSMVYCCKSNKEIKMEVLIVVGLAWWAWNTFAN